MVGGRTSDCKVVSQLVLKPKWRKSNGLLEGDTES
mgnify:CR=1 FL=1